MLLISFLITNKNGRTMLRTLPLLLLCFPAVGTLAQTQLTTSEIKAMTAEKTYSNVAVHDPSVIYNSSDKNYYIIGSHRGVAKSANLIDFSTVNNTYLFNKGYEIAFSSCPTHEVKVTRNGETYTETLGTFDAGAFCSTYAGIQVGDRAPVTQAEWISGDMWAPDMVYNPNIGKWCMYLSLNGDYWASVVIMLTADSPKGPFTYQAPIVFSGFNGQTYSGKSVSYKDTDLELVLGTQASLPARYRTNTWGNLWPNCIDPCVFFDAEGELWMAYGSWSGGIFMLKLDKNTGLRDYTTTYPLTSYSGTAVNGSSYTGYTSDPYFGKLIAGGAYVSGEGPYIQKIGDYYYLFMSYGGFAPDGGYEMRIFRSDKPDGPYKDAAGNSALYTRYLLNFGKRATTNKGMKIIGAMNNWGTMTTGECAGGHNSAIVDKDGDAFVVYHTKFNNNTLWHQVRTRQLFVNEKGWLVASPFRFTGKQTTQAGIESAELFATDEIAGTYQMLIHPYRLDHSKMEEAVPVTVTLSADGKITGDKTGTWKYAQEGKSYVTLSIGGITYYGVALEQNVDGYADMPAICFSAVSNSGIPVWLYKYKAKAAVASAYTPYITDYLLSSNAISKNAPTVDNVTPTFYTTNAESGEPESETLSESGIFTPTSDGHNIKVSVKLESGDYYFLSADYIKATAREGEVVQTPIYYPLSTMENTTAGWWSNFSKQDYVLEQGHSAMFKFYNYSNMEANYKNWCLYGANATHGASGYSEYFGIRCDNWDNTTGSNTGCTSDFNWTTFTSDMNGSLVDMTVNYTESGVFTMKSTITTTTGKKYNYSYTKTLVEKPASITLFFVNEGSYIDGTGIPTDVVSVKRTNKIAQNNKMYNLSGQLVNKNYKGIVIKNGKAIINK